MSDAVRALFGLLRVGDAAEDGLALAPLPSADPDVLERWGTTDEGVPRQVITVFRPRVERPNAYPDDLPFVPAVRVFVTEMSDPPAANGHSGPPASRWGARWLVEDDTDVAAEVLGALLDDGWEVDAGRELGFPFPGLRTVLRRADRARILHEVGLEDGRRVVQLLPLV